MPRKIRRPGKPSPRKKDPKVDRTKRCFSCDMGVHHRGRKVDGCDCSC